MVSMPKATISTKRSAVLACGKREAATMPGTIAAATTAVPAPTGSGRRYPAAMPRTNGMANFIAGLLRNILDLLPNHRPTAGGRLLRRHHLQNDPCRVRQIVRPPGECRVPAPERDERNRVPRVRPHRQVFHVPMVARDETEGALFIQPPGEPGKETVEALENGDRLLHRLPVPRLVGQVILVEYEIVLVGHRREPSPRLLRRELGNIGVSERRPALVRDVCRKSLPGCERRRVIQHAPRSAPSRGDRDRK